MQLFEKFKGLKTLLIDDNQVIRETMDHIFKGNGCYIETAESAEMGRIAIERTDFDIIICDFRLPGMNGIEFLEQVIESHPDTIRVLITGYGSEETIREAFELGVHEFFKKPFSLATFLERLKPHVDKYLEEKGKCRISTEKKTAHENQSVFSIH